MSVAALVRNKLYIIIRDNQRNEGLERSDRVSMVR